MNLFQRNGRWYFKVMIKGKTHKRSCQTSDKDLAQKFADTAIKKIYLQTHTDMDRDETWEEACRAYEIRNRGSNSMKTTRSQIKWLNTHLSGKLVSDITGPILSDIKEASIGTMLPNSNRLRTTTTTNRYMACIRKILKLSQERGMLQTVPVIKLFPEDNARERYLTYEEEAAFLDQLSRLRSKHTYWGVRFGLATGMRHGNIRGLKWTDVNLAERRLAIGSQSMKAKKQLVIPLDDEAMEIINAQIGIHDTYVFSYAGHKVKTYLNTGFKLARERAGFGSWLVFHTMRHTWASRLGQAGVHPIQLQALGGWESLQMVERYCKMDLETLRATAQQASLDRASRKKPVLAIVPRRQE